MPERLRRMSCFGRGDTSDKGVFLHQLIQNSFIFSFFITNTDVMNTATGKVMTALNVEFYS